MPRIFSILLLFCFLLPIQSVNAQDNNPPETITKETRYNINKGINPDAPAAFDMYAGPISNLREFNRVTYRQYKDLYPLREKYDANFGPVTINLHPAIPKGELSVEDLRKISMIVSGAQVASMFFAPELAIPFRLGQVAIDFQITRKKEAIYKEERARLCLMLSDDRIIPDDYANTSNTFGGYTRNDLCMPDRSPHLWINFFSRALFRSVYRRPGKARHSQRRA